MLIYSYCSHCQYKCFEARRESTVHHQKKKLSSVEGYFIHEYANCSSNLELQEGRSLCMTSNALVTPVRNVQLTHQSKKGLKIWVIMTR